MHTTDLNIAAAKSRGFILAVKAVRGAYLDQERALAKEKGIQVCVPEWFYWLL